MPSTRKTTVDASTPKRFVVTFRHGARTQALALLKKCSGLSKADLMNSTDFGTGGARIDQVPATGGVIFEHLNMAVVCMPNTAMELLSRNAGEDSAVLAVEPERIMHVLGPRDGLPLDYLRGFRDAADTLYRQAKAAQAAQADRIAADFSDTRKFTWGLQAIGTAASRFSGKGSKIAVLDTGLDLEHPDFTGRDIASQSFVEGSDSAQDGHGHGTHCIGTACGPRQPSEGRRYGIAWAASIYAGKVLADDGSGGDMSILAGIDWAVANHCQVISLSLGADVQDTSTAYETAGQRALQAGSLIVAAAGNNARRSEGYYGFVGRPANSRTFMAIGAVDGHLAVADFSARDTVRAAGTAVDLAAPGVDVYSSWPMPARTRTISGTSMATPHVAGIAALWAEASEDRGTALWHRLITNAQSLSAAGVDVGRGLVQAP